MTGSHSPLSTPDGAWHPDKLRAFLELRRWLLENQARPGDLVARYPAADGREVLVFLDPPHG